MPAYGHEITVPAGFDDECLHSRLVWLDNPGSEVGRRVLVTLDGSPDVATSRITAMSASASLV